MMIRLFANLLWVIFSVVGRRVDDSGFVVVVVVGWRVDDSGFEGVVVFPERR